MHISSLPSNLGIGTLGKPAYRFVDFLKENGQTFWQILPINIPDSSNSPYQSPSTFAGNPMFIDLDILHDEGYLQYSNYKAIDWGESNRVDYKRLNSNRKRVFLQLYNEFLKKQPSNYKKFCQDNAWWLDDFSFFMENKDQMPYHKMLQYFFYKQWFKLKKYANNKGIKIIGDIPFYVSGDGVDVQKNAKIFIKDELAGCPPDKFSEEGQLWGCPTYNWKILKETGYKWWLDRLCWCHKIYDAVRIDHFRAFDSYYCIKKGQKTAKNGIWRQGPKMDFINKVNKKLPLFLIIAEDLGFVTNSVKELVRASGYYSMKVLQFAFDERESGDYLPHNYNKKSVAYTGTHDNNTILGWANELPKSSLEYAKKYLRANDIRKGLMAAALASHSDICILTMQDIIGLNKEGRINTPGTLKNNWEWRATELDILSVDDFLRKNTKLYGRWNNETT